MPLVDERYLQPDLVGKSPQRLTFTSIDRLVFAGLYRSPGMLDAMAVSLAPAGRRLFCATRSTPS
jgi:hypothetical protein